MALGLLLMEEAVCSISDADMMVGMVSHTNPSIPNLEELKVSLVNWLSKERPEPLECKVERFLSAQGHVL